MLHLSIRPGVGVILAACGAFLPTGLVPATARADEPAAVSCSCSDCLPACGLRDAKTLFSWCGEPEQPSEEDKDAPIETDRPDFTEATTTVGRSRVQLETGYTFVYDDDSGVQTSDHSFPESLLRVGMLAEWFEFRLGWNYRVTRTRTPTGVDTVDGAEDLYLGMKLALTEQKGWLPEVAVVPQMTTPTGAGAFTQDEVMPGVNLLYGWELGNCYSLGASTQGNRALDPSGDFYTEIAQSVTVGRELTDKLKSYVEWFGLFPYQATDPDTLPENYLNGGFAYLVTNDLQLDIRAGIGLNDAADDFFAGTGLSVRY